MHLKALAMYNAICFRYVYNYIFAIVINGKQEIGCGVEQQKKKQKRIQTLCIFDEYKLGYKYVGMSVAKYTLSYASQAIIIFQRFAHAALYINPLSELEHDVVLGVCVYFFHFSILFCC